MKRKRLAVINTVKHQANRLWLVLCLVGLSSFVLFGGALVPISGDSTKELGSISSQTISKEKLAETIGLEIANNLYPEKIEIPVKEEKKPFEVEYTLDAESQKFVEKLLKSYQPDYAAFVAVDASTGEILVMASSSKVEPNSENLALKATFPAASIFKVITASAALDTDRAHPNTVVPFNGGNHTLYKRNATEGQINRWTRFMTMREAFARSVNMFFGKLGLYYVGPQNLQEYAHRYQFNQVIKADMPIQIGLTQFSSEDPWSVVAAASGFTRDTTMSPLQGALIAAAVAHNGVMMEPYIVDRLYNEAGEVAYSAEKKTLSTVVEPESAAELRTLFNETVSRGTSRRHFRKTLKRSIFDEVEFGGKTGSLTGLNPKGKCDWFVGYAIYKDTKVAVAALTVNQLKWRVKSSTLANEFFVQYLRDDLPEEKAERKKLRRRHSKRRS